MWTSRACQREASSSSAIEADSMVWETWAARTASSPRRGTRAGTARSDSNRLTVPSPQAPASSGRAEASRSPAAMPMEVSRAEETTAGRPSRSVSARARRTPPSGATLMIATSAASSLATASGSSDRRTDSSAAIGTLTALRNRARSSTSAQGCSAYCSPPAALFITGKVARAVSRSQAALTSMRTCPCAPRAPRTAARRSRSSATPSAVPLTLTLAVVAADWATSS